MDDDATVPDSGIGPMLMSSRSLAEYRAMFTLSRSDLGRRILDCPGGAASLTAEVSRAGGAAVACDPVYGNRDVDDLSAAARAEIERGNLFILDHPDQYRWGFFADPEDHLHSRGAAAALFAADLRAQPSRYVAGALPHLPFGDASFDLVLSSHLLFSYADRLDLSFHRSAVLELVRVSRHEVRLFPLVAMGAVRYPALQVLLDQLRAAGVVAGIVDVDYELQAGGNQMLVCRRG
jgi:SAM-dependent methyltransferase